MTAPSREAIEALIDYLDEEAEWEISSAGELTDLGKILRRHEVTARALLAQRERDEKVKVKPLAWFHGQADGVFAVEVWSAETYTIEERAHTEVFDLFCALWDGEQAQRYDTLEAAKAAAQADYERRILSALVARDAGGE